jgi:hypothetical protein
MADDQAGFPRIPVAIVIAAESSGNVMERRVTPCNCTCAGFRLQGASEVSEGWGNLCDPTGLGRLDEPGGEAAPMPGTGR